jgi:hypothetical protein
MNDGHLAVKQEEPFYLLVRNCVLKGALGTACILEFQILVLI